MDVAYRIKPLEWVAHPLDAECFACDTALGVYGVARNCHTGAVRWWYCNYAHSIYECESVDAGKQAAEQHYRERIAPALEVA